MADAGRDQGSELATRRAGSAKPRHTRTAAEAIVQADAKFRIFNAIGLRLAGLPVVVFGISRLVRASTWRLGSSAVQITLPGRSPFMVSLEVLLMCGVTVVGLGMTAIGHWQVGRAIRAARENPITAQVFDQLMPPGEE